MNNPAQDALDAFDVNSPELIRDIELETERVVIEEAELATMDNQLKLRKSALDESKKSLAMKMIENNLQSLTFESGLAPRVKTETKVYRQAGVAEERVVEWFRDNGLGGCIKESVHFQTQQASIKQRLAQNESVPPELFNVQEVPAITLGGKSKFLQQITTNKG